MRALEQRYMKIKCVLFFFPFSLPKPDLNFSWCFITGIIAAIDVILDSAWHFFNLFSIPHSRIRHYRAFRMHLCDRVFLYLPFPPRSHAHLPVTAAGAAPTRVNSTMPIGPARSTVFSPPGLQCATLITTPIPTPIPSLRYICRCLRPRLLYTIVFVLLWACGNVAGLKARSATGGLEREKDSHCALPE